MENSLAERLILVVQENPDHAHLIQTVFDESAIPHQIVAIASGAEVMNFLQRKGSYTDVSRPDLILLDLNLSDQTGKDILAKIKADSQLRRIPIVVLSSAAHEADVFSSYTLQGNCYVVKSSNPEQLSQIIKRIEEFWLGIVTLPIE